MRFDRRMSRVALVSACGIGLAGLTGCNNAGEGVFTGATLGALSGLVIGSMSGNAGDGAAIGAVSGAVIGGFVGDQNDRADRRAHRYPPPRHHSHDKHGYHSDPWWDDDCDW